MARSYTANGIDKLLTTAMNPSSTSLVVDDDIDLPTAPFYIVIDPLDELDREFILVGTQVGPLLSNLTRNLAGSNSQYHDVGATVRLSITAQTIDDLWDEIETHTHSPGAHNVVDHTDTAATGAELDTLTDGSNADSLHSHVSPAHTIASHSDTTATGTELETLTDGSNADTLHIHSTVAHTIVSHSDTSATGAELNTLTDGSNADALHTHSASSGVEILEAAVSKGTRPTLNFESGISVVDNPGQDRIDLEVTVSGTVADGNNIGDRLYWNGTAWVPIAGAIVVTEAPYNVPNDGTGDCSTGIRAAYAAAAAAGGELEVHWPTGSYRFISTEAVPVLPNLSNGDIFCDVTLNVAVEIRQTERPIKTVFGGSGGSALSGGTNNDTNNSGVTIFWDDDGEDCDAILFHRYWNGTANVPDWRGFHYSGGAIFKDLTSSNDRLHAGIMFQGLNNAEIRDIRGGIMERVDSSGIGGIEDREKVPAALIRILQPDSTTTSNEKTTQYWKFYNLHSADALCVVHCVGNNPDGDIYDSFVKYGGTTVPDESIMYWLMGSATRIHRGEIQESNYGVFFDGLSWGGIQTGGHDKGNAKHCGVFGVHIEAHQNATSGYYHSGILARGDAADSASGTNLIIGEGTNWGNAGNFANIFDIESTMKRTKFNHAYIRGNNPPLDATDGSDSGANSTYTP